MGSKRNFQKKNEEASQPPHYTYIRPILEWVFGGHNPLKSEQYVLGYLPPVGKIS